MADIGDALAAAARSMNRRGSMDETLQAIVEAARVSLPSFEHVGISTTSRKGKVVTRAATTQQVWDLDALQYALGQGPCVDTLRGEPVVAAPRLRHDQRWPQYVPRAVKEHGLKAQLGLRLYLDEEGTVGGLNMYSTEHDEFAEEDLSIAELFATHAALAFGRAREVDNLTQALRSRTVIGQAIGLVMAQYGIGEDAAFAFLRRASSHGNIKLHDIAQDIVDEANARAGNAQEP
jgi:GAF domain-containing protein